ncbi:MAG TPA: hypothetical protein VEC16_03285 [Alphaproteobacteria bacterium]|nr:hypothetical protein [Alphaproteobacteria bacterium]
MTQSKTITIDFKKIWDNIVRYFKTLTQDMLIAWSVLGAGLLILIIGLAL